MEILEFSLFVLFPAALAIFALGATYRLFRYVFLYRKGVYIHRDRSFAFKIKSLVLSFLRPISFNLRTKPMEFVFGFILMHAIGLILLIFLLAQHIAYIEAIIPFYGLLWPLAIPISPITGALTVTSPVGVKQVETLWGPLTVILNGDFLAIFAIMGAVYKSFSKLYEKLKGHKNVRIGDLLIWSILLAILITGWLASHHTPSDIVGYRAILGLHIAFAALFVVVWPFTKYFHFLWGYWYGKLHEWYDVAIKRGA
ncbi:MAG: hypothetical protein QXI18_02075 [Nitrososphaerota archaeon]|uniref:Respiratory nitrate reductase subunit gamma n=2 Tax=Pyrobaculum arsenaticum TaxID=121277 RepID=A4WKE6_PYRAR|nr:hypothetical protein [Pyrobaculum arsenaticum]ABP50863.1 conserved hypothetical protein [Pyrobaculum arsenaticum DSM 13514]MCY0891350.1 hypothetical protein [Pyrobaculum arsenaticum]NYR15417.1 hypothetical protein [Pyrobaculum arsenaticum]